MDSLRKHFPVEILSGLLGLPQPAAGVAAEALFPESLAVTLICGQKKMNEPLVWFGTQR